MVFPIFKAGRAGYSMLKLLYKGGKKARKTVGLTDKAKNWKNQLN